MRALARRFLQGCNDPGCVRPEFRLHRSLLQPTQRSDTSPSREADAFERAAHGQARDRSFGPGPINRHFAGQRGRSHRLHRRWVTFGRRYDTTIIQDSNPQRLPYSTTNWSVPRRAILISSSLVW
ncbi:hypothetical protein MTO96_027813 [Rhipicephalus appendiculatus]